MKASLTLHYFSKRFLGVFTALCLCIFVIAYVQESAYGQESDDDVAFTAEELEKNKQAQIDHEKRHIPTYRKLLTSIYSQHNKSVDEFINVLIVNEALLNKARKSNASATNIDDAKLDDKSLLELQQYWPTVISAWANVAALPIDALMEDNHLLKIESYPLRKGFVEKKVSELLLAEDFSQSIKTHEDLQSQSVVVQGLPAMEYLLFNVLENEKNRNHNHALHLALLINQNIQAIMTQVKHHTIAHIQQFEDDSFNDILLALDDVINRLDAGFVELIKKRLLPNELVSDLPVAEQTNYSWYQSGLSIDYLLQRIRQSSQYLYHQDSQYHVADLLLDIRYRGVASLLQQKVENIIAQVTAVEAQLTQNNRLIDNEIKASLTNLRTDLTDLEKYLTSAIYASVDISRDFNSTDGD